MAEPGTLEEKAARYEDIEDSLLAELDKSLSPRGPELLYDVVAEMELPAGCVVLDAGCGKGRQLVELARRFGFQMVGIEPISVQRQAAAQAVATASASLPGLAERIRVERGRVEDLPLEDDSIDLVWCKDVLPLVDDWERAYSEFARVLRPGHRAIIYQSCLAPDLTDSEAQRFWEPLEAAETRSDPARVESAIAASGLRLDRWFSVALEWGEYGAETEGKAGRRLLHLARLLRDPDRYIDKFGQWAYDVVVADCYWHTFRMMGKIDERVYLLTKPE